MQKIVLFIEPNDDAWITPFKIANLIMNRFYFEEKASFKIVQIFELGKSSYKLPLSDQAMKDQRKKEYSISEEERNKKGMNLSTWH